MTIHEYIERKSIRQNTTALLKDGKMYRWYKGRWISEKVFDKIYPVPTRIGKAKPNPDGTKAYLL